MLRLEALRILKGVFGLNSAPRKVSLKVSTVLVDLEVRKQRMCLVLSVYTVETALSLV